MRKLAVLSALILSAIVIGVSGQMAYAEPANNQKPETKIVVGEGDTLGKIAKAHDTTYPRLFDANLHIADPDLIYPGDEVRIPAADEVLASRPLPQKTPAPVKTTATKPALAKPKAVAKTKGTRVKAKPAVNKPAPGDGSVWDRLAACESGGRWNYNGPSGFDGGLQFLPSTWTAYKPSGYPTYAWQASKEQQIEVASRVQASQGWKAWPACSAKLGIL